MVLYDPPEPLPRGQLRALRDSDRIVVERRPTSGPFGHGEGVPHLTKLDVIRTS